MRFRTVAFTAGVLFVAAESLLPARQPGGPVNPSLFAEMRWRNIGPMRAGRTKAGTGVPSQPFTFYIGMVNGGVWKTANAGRTWTPIFEDQPTGSIGAIAVSESNPDIVYVGTGEGLQRPDLAVGDGIYKSADAGKTWTHLGLGDGQQIPKIVVDPKNPDRLFVAVLGHPYGPNEERGIFRSTDGGRSFQKILFKDENTGGKDVDLDPVNPDIVYATLYESRQGPWENAAWTGSNGGVFKSVDGGNTWKPLTAGLPNPVVMAELTIAPSNPRRLYAIATGLPPAGGRGGRGAGGAPTDPGAPVYRSDDAGETWTHITRDTRPAARANEAAVTVDPTNPDSVILTDIVSYKSEDGGRTWVPYKGAPGGDDYQGAWINPTNTNIVLLTSDQGAVVSLDKGASWSSWYTQSTAAMFHVMTDNAFPYRVCGGQQDSGSACVASRGNDGAITMREWHPAGIEEYGYAAPDPLNPDIVYGSKVVTRYDRRTGQVSEVGPFGRGAAPPAGQGRNAVVNRQVRTQPLVFSQVDKRSLFYGTNVLWKTMDGGINWKQISPDPTRKTHDLAKSIGKYAEQAKTQADENGARVIYTIGPSYTDINRIWIGTDDGVIQTTADGGLRWSDVTPKQLGSYWKVFTIDAGRFAALTAYAAVNTLRLDDMNPHIYRTHDGGKTWTEIVNGIPGGAPVSVVREDVKRKGLLFAGSETGVYVSFDDGDHWQSLRLNMAASSVRDLVIKDDDLVVGTHGRGIWILDDITPLRQIDAASADRDMLFKPQTALRVRWNTNTDTPLPPDEIRSPNPPDGAIINYYLKGPASGPVVLEILGWGNRVVRRYSSDDPVAQLPDPARDAPVPLYWYRPPQSLSAAAGMHRFLWDVHYQPLPPIPGAGSGRGGGLPIASIPFNTVPNPTTPWVAPGVYTVKLTVNGQSHTQPLIVKVDPRVRTPPVVMQQVYTLSHAMYREAADAIAAVGDARRIRDEIAKLQPQATGDLASTLAELGKKLEALAPPLTAAVSGPGGLTSVLNILQGADVQPTSVQLKAIATARGAASAAMAKWSAITAADLPAINARLKAAGLPALTRTAETRAGASPAPTG